MGKISKGKWAALILSLVVIGAIGAVVAKRMSERKAAEEKREAEAKIPKVLALSEADVLKPVTLTTAPTLTLSGALEPSAQGVAKARAAGTLIGAAKREGDFVAKGETLGSVDAVDLRMRLTQQESLRAQAGAQLETARKNRAAQQALLEKGFISQTAFDNTDGTFQAARAAFDAANAQVSLASQSLKDTTLVSPMAGIVSRRHVEPGERVTTEMTVYTLMQIDALEFAPQVPVEDAARLRVGMMVEVNVPGAGAANTTAPREATIVRIAPAANASTRTVDVRARLANPDRALKAGTSVTGSVALAAPTAALAIPLDTLRAADSAPHVYVLAGDRATRKNITLGARDEKRAMVFVRDGITADDRLISARVQELRDGQTVKMADKVPSAQISPLPASGTGEKK